MESRERNLVRWLGQADDDLAYGRMGIDGYPRAACWQFQQSAEKALKGMLISQDVDFPRTHDIARFLTLVEETGFHVDVLREPAFRLASFVPVTRYPGDFPDLSREDALQAETDAEMILVWVRQRLGEPG